MLVDQFMSKVFGGKIECTQLILDINLGHPGLHVTSVKEALGQHEINNVKGHNVKLDIRAKDDAGKYYDIESSVKTLVRIHCVHDPTAVCSTRRSCQQELSYSELKESYVIFITENDVLGDGIPVHDTLRHKDLPRCASDRIGAAYTNYNKCPGQISFRQMADRLQEGPQSHGAGASLSRIRDQGTP